MEDRDGQRAFSDRSYTMHKIQLQHHVVNYNNNYNMADELSTLLLLQINSLLG